jgi:hypothetical protein
MKEKLKFVKYLDMYGQPIQFSYKDSNYFSTICGMCTSLIAIFLIILYGCLIIKDVLTYEKPKILEQAIVTDDSDKLNHIFTDFSGYFESNYPFLDIPRENQKENSFLQISVGFQNRKNFSFYPLDPKYFYIQFSSIKKVENSKGNVTINETSLFYDYCTRFPFSPRTSKIDMQTYRSLCLYSPFILKGDSASSDFRKLKINLNMCSNDSIVLYNKTQSKEYKRLNFLFKRWIRKNNRNYSEYFLTHDELISLDMNNDPILYNTTSNSNTSMQNTNVPYKFSNYTILNNSNLVKIINSENFNFNSSSSKNNIWLNNTPQGNNTTNYRTEFKNTNNKSTYSNEDILNTNTSEDNNNQITNSTEYNNSQNTTITENKIINANSSMNTSSNTYENPIRNTISTNQNLDNNIKTFNNKNSLASTENVKLINSSRIVSNNTILLRNLQFTLPDTIPNLNSIKTQEDILFSSISPHADLLSRLNSTNNSSILNSNSTFIKVTCAPQSEILRRIKDTEIVLFFTLYEFNSTNLQNPISSRVNYVSLQPSTLLKKTFFTEFSKDVVTSYSSLVPFPMYVGYEGIVKHYISKMKIDVQNIGYSDFDLKNSFLAFDLRLSALHTEYTRQFKDIFEILGVVGGISRVIILIGHVCVFYFVNLKFKESMINEFYSVIDPKNIDLIEKDFETYLKERGDQITQPNYIKSKHNISLQKHLEEFFNENLILKLAKTDKFSKFYKKHEVLYEIYKHKVNSNITYSPFELLANIFCFCCLTPKLKKKNLTFKKAWNRLIEDTDFTSILKSISEFQDMIKIFFDESQNEIFKSYKNDEIVMSKIKEKEDIDDNLHKEKNKIPKKVQEIYDMSENLENILSKNRIFEDYDYKLLNQMVDTKKIINEFLFERVNLKYSSIKSLRNRQVNPEGKEIYFDVEDIRNINNIFLGKKFFT